MALARAHGRGKEVAAGVQHLDRVAGIEACSTSGVVAGVAAGVGGDVVATWRGRKDAGMRTDGLWAGRPRKDHVLTYCIVPN